MSFDRIVRIALALAWSVGLAHAGNVRIAERPLVGPFPTLQSAVDAAFEGESLLVTPGTYAPFVIDGKSVDVIVTGGGEAKITGMVRVKNLSSVQSVVLSRLEVKATAVVSNPLPALEITNVLGHLRVEVSSFTGAGVFSSSQVSGTGVRITSSLNVVFARCQIFGGSPNASYGGELPSDGGTGVDSINASVALYECSIYGGNGSYESAPSGGDGGDAYHCSSYGVFFSDCSLRGGGGGGGDYVGCNVGGIGGDGLHVNAAQAHLFSTTCNAGTGGWSSCGPYSGPGLSIVPLNGGIIDQMPGTRRRIVVDSIVADDASVPITITGQQGDVVYLVLARQPAFVWSPPQNGVWLVRRPLLSNALPAGIIGASGTLVVNRSFSIPDGAFTAYQTWVQAICIDTSGQATLTGPGQVLSLDAASAPDCNGNGRQDALDVLFGGIPDCDGNLTPDACEIDCNGNGILDSCDIATHVSSDFNGNGVPDECEAQYLTWYVDDSASAGGNGSQSSPFQSVQQAVAASGYGDTIEIADGIYHGESDMSGRNLTVRSANGPANCTIDCQGVSRAFRLDSNANVTFEGLKIVNGFVTGDGGGIRAVISRFTVRNCTFANCFARSSGGAVWVAGSSCTLRLEDCRFLGNSSFYDPVQGKGGAVYISSAQWSARDCFFANNLAGSGGAIYLGSLNGQAALTHCTFLENHANGDGGALNGFAGTGQSTIDDCLFAGNSAANSGGALTSYVDMNISNSTFVSNRAVVRGGSIHFKEHSSGTLSNSIVWGSTAPTGAQICLGGNVTPVAPLTVSYCDIEGKQAGVAVFQGILTWGAGNLDINPQFQDADGPDNDPLTFADNDYSLSPSSPCIDAGDNGALVPDLLDVNRDGDTTELVPLDLRHAPRRVDVISVPDSGAGTAPIVDMGALERQG